MFLNLPAIFAIVSSTRVPREKFGAVKWKKALIQANSGYRLYLLFHSFAFFDSYKSFSVLPPHVLMYAAASFPIAARAEHTFIGQRREKQIFA